MLYDWYFIKKLYTVEECQQIVDLCKKNASEAVKDIHPTNKNLDVVSIETASLGTSVDKFFNYTQKLNKRMFGLDLWNEPPLAMNLNIYNKNQEYPYHRDKNSPGETSDVKLTAILNVSQETYTGGDFSLFLGDEKVIPEINETGTLLIFPSYLYHKVSPVTSGQRLTLSAWLEGPNWK